MDRYDLRAEAFRWLRRTIGITGITLPFVLVAVHWFGSQTWDPPATISGYYHTDVRYLFVVVLFSVAVLLWSYPGYDDDDDLLGNIASVLTLGVVVFPERAPEDHGTFGSVLGALHYGSAAGMFVSLAVFCLFLFRRTEADRGKAALSGMARVRAFFSLRAKTEKLSRQKRRRNRLYFGCGIVILVCIGLILALGLYGLSTNTIPLAAARPTLVLEGIALIAFGLSWIVKGDSLFADPRDDDPSSDVVPRT